MKRVLLRRADIIGQKYSNLVENFTRYKNPIIANGRLGTHNTVNHDGDEIIGKTTFEPGDKPWKVVSRIFGAGNTQSNRTAIASNAIYTIDVATSSSQFALRATVRKDRATILSDPLVYYGTNGTIGSVGGLWYSLEYDGDKTYTLSVSRDNQTWSSVSAESIEDDPHTPHTIVGAAVFGNTNGYEAYVDLNKHIITSLFDTAIYIDGKIWWTPYLDKSKMLPDEYQEVEYIGLTAQSTNYPNINTGVKLSDGPARIKLSVKTKTFYTNGLDILSISSGRNSGQQRMRIRAGYNSSNGYYYTVAFGSNPSYENMGISITETSSAFVDTFNDNKYEIVGIDAYMSQNDVPNAQLSVTYTIGDVSETVTKTGGTGGTDAALKNSSIVLFGMTGNTKFIGYIYGHLMVWNDGKLVLDAVPCYRKSDNVKGMYNIVKQKFLIPSSFNSVFELGDAVQSPIPEYAYYFES